MEFGSGNADVGKKNRRLSSPKGFEVDFFLFELLKKERNLKSLKICVGPPAQ